jgi:HAD superfamily hydrolase (TIGR01509 family)
MTEQFKKIIFEKNYPDFQPKAVFFDMDGVLFDSMPLHAKAWQTATNEFGFDFSLYDAYMHEGRTGDSTIDEISLLKYGKPADEKTKKELYKRKSDIFNSYNEQPKQIKDVYDLLKMLKSKNLQILVVTGSAQISLINMLDEHFPNIFEENKMVTAFDCKIGKPDPEPYLMALEKAKVEAWQALVVENAPLGVRSAVAAGIFTIGVNTGILQPEELKKEGANIVLPNMKTLIEFFIKLLDIRL